MEERCNDVFDEFTHVLFISPINNDIEEIAKKLKVLNVKS